MSIVDLASKETLSDAVRRSHSYKEVLINLGYHSPNGNSYKTVKKRIELYGIDVSHFRIKRCTKRNFENVFCEHSDVTQKVLREHYYKGNYSEYSCAICGMPPVWMDKPLTLTLDHINGVNGDNRIENLRWICPNCDRQLPTFSRGAYRGRQED